MVVPVVFFGGLGTFGLIILETEQIVEQEPKPWLFGV